ncbi:hypothetical protein EG329_007990 [Mollisiaceae sp. DMI_Dod_QoI]|nr:hypothetical protein EG329_007990 [Helotiales sp. DMI_Dod_QoI]
MSISGSLITFGTEPNSGYTRAIVTSDGTLLIIVTKGSKDQGASWSNPVVGAGVVNRPGMPQILNLDNGGMNLMMVYESNANGGPMQVWAKTSSDGGNTWGDPNLILDNSPGNAGEPGITSIPGFLVVSSGSDMNMKVITNTNSDGSGAWSQPITVIPGADYGGVTTVEGGVMVLGTVNQIVVMQKFIP